LTKKLEIHFVKQKTLEEKMSKKVLVATVKPFASEAVEQIGAICKESGYEMILMEKYPDQSDLVEAVKEVDALIIRSDKVTEEVINNSRNLKVVVRAGAGYDNVDLKAATEKGIIVMNTPGQNSNAVAELALGMMVYMARGQYNGKPGTELKEKKIGIHAFGNVGKNIARIALGFGMKVYAFDPFLKPEQIRDAGVEPVENADELYRNCDYISLNLPSNAETKGSINESFFKLMKPNAAVINTARKEVVNEDDLIKIFGEREGLKYASDIAPEKADEILEKFGNRCYFTPKKMGAQTKEANVNAGIAAIRQIIAYFEKGDTTFQVNK
jgi:D-3-phosphoglycerate dehydrogenase